LSQQMTITTPAVTGLDQAAVQARIAAGRVNRAPPEAGRTLSQILLDGTFSAVPLILALAPGAPRARPGFTRRVLAFAVPAGVSIAQSSPLERVNPRG
jgi:hypothetical protein